MIDATLFRRTMGHFASGVTVVTTRQRDGQLCGLTVSSFTSLSLNPPLILVCIDLRGTTHSALRAADRFAVNILSETQADVSQRFAMHDVEKFPAGSYRLSDHGIPLLEGVLAQIECRITQQLPGGDHTIFVGEVEHSTLFDGRPLLYYRSGYHRLPESAS
jgi:flavin reductase (DIM6/NTAB) family NADH-FMN oxidoreductase RutF